MNPDARIAPVVAFFGNMSEADLPRLADCYAESATFEDPFQSVQGLAAIRAVYAHMFATLDAPRFEITACVGQGDDWFLVWDFRFRTRGRGARDWCIHGTSRLQLGEDGRIVAHRDYWDAAGELYAKLPVLGALMRWLQGRLRGH
jgi:steroid delta-isomerase